MGEVLSTSSEAPGNPHLGVSASMHQIMQITTVVCIIPMLYAEYSFGSVAPD